MVLVLVSFLHFSNMAKKAICTIFLVDMGKDTPLEVVSQALSSYVLTRILNNQHDQVAVILYGSDKTNNPVNFEVGVQLEYREIPAC